jgi:hypothetical protein
MDDQTRHTWKVITQTRFVLCLHCSPNLGTEKALVSHLPESVVHNYLPRGQENQIGKYSIQIDDISYLSFQLPRKFVST